MTREPLPTDPRELPPLPAEYDDALEDGLGALGIRLAPGTRRAIDDHVRLLLAWTTRINLTAVRSPVEVARLHVVDSLTAVPLLREAGSRTLLDIGSGGGMPGIPLALAVPMEDSLLVDSVAKKVRFLETAARAIGGTDRIRAVAARSEALARDPVHRERWGVVTARAVAPLGELVELAFPLLRVGGLLVAWKRGDIDDELDDARRVLGTLGGGAFGLVDPGVPSLPGHRLVTARKEQSAPANYPGRPAERRRTGRR